ncbi:MAG: NACHT domain-containing protein, partial [Anaerolineae bacterium]|nr:NACHT domain-containing protein [Anaerolineae bacterium]
MDLSTIPPEWLAIITGGAANLVSEFVKGILEKATPVVKRKILGEEATRALEKVVVESIAEVVKDWEISAGDAQREWKQFGAWLLVPEVIDEFAKLLTPNSAKPLDIARLRRTFIAEGLQLGDFSEEDIEAFITALVATFYDKAAAEPLLQGVLQISILRSLGSQLQQLVKLQKSENQAQKKLIHLLTALTQKSLPSPTDFAALEQKHRQSIIDRFDKLTFKGISPTGKPIALELEKVYVELKAVADVPDAADTYSADERRLLVEANEKGESARWETAMHLDTLRLQRWKREARNTTERLQRRSIQEVMRDPAQPGLVILGDPGSGKSTLLHYLALRAAKKPVGDELPIFISFAAYDDYLTRHGHISLGEFLSVYYAEWQNSPDLKPLFEQALSEGRALVLLDGLDEVLQQNTRQFVAEQANSFIAQWRGQGNRFVVTSRVVGYREAQLSSNLPHVTVLDFGTKEIEQFAHQWCLTYEVWARGDSPTVRHEAEIEEKYLLTDVRSNASVQLLATNPLLLTLLALLRRQVGKLPDRRIVLYAKYTENMLTNWSSARSHGARRSDIDRFDTHRATDHLIELALWLQRHRPSGTSTKNDLERELQEICLRFDGHDRGCVIPKKAQIVAAKDAEAFIKDIREIAGLLVERGHDAFGFLHLTFQEYYAARGLAKLDPQQRWEVIQPILHLPRWREPILLCAGQLGIAEGRRDEVSRLVLRIMNAGSEYEDILHRDLFLAAAIAADDVRLQANVLNQIHQRLHGLLWRNKDKPIPTLVHACIHALLHLARLGDADSMDSICKGLNTAFTLDILRHTTLPLLIEIKGEVYHLVIGKLDDEFWDVRSAAVAALGSLVASDEGVRGRILAKLDDEF